MVKTTGFTLIEFMIVIAIFSILAAVALPAYRDYVESVEGPKQACLSQGAGYIEASRNCISPDGVVFRPFEEENKNLIHDDFHKLVNEYCEDSMIRVKELHGDAVRVSCINDDQSHSFIVKRNPGF